MHLVLDLLYWSSLNLAFDRICLHGYRLAEATLLASTFTNLPYWESIFLIGIKAFSSTSRLACCHATSIHNAYVRMGNISSH